MLDKICLIPCNGLDKPLGVVTREVALKLTQKHPNLELICPVLFNVKAEKYEKQLEAARIFVLDGCATRCATKLVDNKSYKISKKIYIPDMVKKFQLNTGKELILNEAGNKLVDKIVEGISDDLAKEAEQDDQEPIVKEFGKIDYFEVTVDKFYFRVPKDGYYFNENDCWVKPEGKTAFVGITDYYQNKAGDVIFIELPEVGKKFDQFDEIADFESVKALLQLISPVTGKILNVNKALPNNPEMLNQDAYEQGWLVEMELADFEEDKELLLTGPEYFEFMKKKIAEETN